MHDPFPLPVGFRPVQSPLFDHWASIRRTPRDTNPEPLALAGQLDRIVEVYRSIPSRRLIVLGEAGSGKTILTLRFVLDWLEARSPSTPVPVIFSLGSWDPSDASLRDWMRGQLVRDYPGLAAPSVHGGNLADALVDADRILPVLDGFDEIASGLHGAALDALNSTAMPLLLTSRPAEYAAAVKESDVLTAAAVIELDALSLDDLADYLRRATRPAVAGDTHSTLWEPVLTHLRDNPQSPGAINLSQTLTTPLMVSLARIVYSDVPGRDPAELLDSTRFATPEALQNHLLSAFIPAVYQPTPTSRGTSRRPRWKPEHAQRWLDYLAAHLDQLDTHDLAWWELGSTLRRPTRMIVIGFLAALAFGITTGIGNLPIDLIATTHGLGFAITRGIVVGLLHGLAAGLTFGIGYGLVSRTGGVAPSPVRIQIVGGTRGKRAKIVSRFMLGAGFAIPFAIVLVLVDRFVVEPLGFNDGLDGGLRGALLLPVEIGLGAGCVFAIMAWLERPIDIESAVSASDLLTTNRNNVVFYMLVWLLVLGIPIGLVFGITAGPIFGILAGLVFGIEGAFGGGLPYGLSFTAWGQWFALSRVWLPLTGRLPWTLIAFLQDARQRGVLRQAGAVYQFRHARLQEHLTSTGSRTP